MKRAYKRWRVAAKVEAIVKLMKCCHSLMQRNTVRNYDAQGSHYSSDINLYPIMSVDKFLFWVISLIFSFRMHVTIQKYYNCVNLVLKLIKSNIGN